MREQLNKLWPLALCIAVGLSCSLGSNSEREGQSSESDSPSSPSIDTENGLAGTTWKGTFKCDDGDEIPANYRFAESGNPIYEYQTKGGAREVELTSEGQTLRFVPPEGGVRNIVIDSISISPAHISHTMTISNERTSGGTLDQSKSVISSEAALSGDQLEVEIAIRSQGVTSQPGIMVPGDESRVICRGKLKR